MSRVGPIIIIDDDYDDWEIYKVCFSELEVDNHIHYFSLCEQALDYLCTTLDAPFIIVCDINMPRMNGIEFRKKINESEYLRKKSIPFIFMSTSVSQNVIDQAYDLTVQGFFEKGKNLGDTKEVIRLTIDYWKRCRHPNSQ